MIDRDVKQRKLGRPKDEKKAAAFEKVVGFLCDIKDHKKSQSATPGDTDNDQITIND